MTEKLFVRPLTVLRTELNTIERLVDQGADAEIILARVDNLRTWLPVYREARANAGSGQSRYDGQEILQAEDELKTFLRAWDLVLRLIEQNSESIQS